METHVIGKAAAVTAALATPAADQLTGLRNLILDLLFGSPVITAKEWATAVERTSNTLSLETLAKWYRNAVREIARREEAATPAEYLSGQQKEEIIRLLNHPAVTRRHKTRVLLGLNRYQADEARDLIANLTAYIAAPFGGGATGTAWVSSSGQLVNFSTAA